MDTLSSTFPNTIVYRGSEDDRAADRATIAGLLYAYAGEALRFTEHWAAAQGMHTTDARAMAALGEAHRAGCAMTAGPAYGKYVEGLKKGHNYFRWMEYAFSSSLMVVLIAALIGIFGANMSMILFGWLMEKYEQPGRPDWTAFIFGCIAVGGTVLREPQGHPSGCPCGVHACPMQLSEQLGESQPLILKRRHLGLRLVQPLLCGHQRGEVGRVGRV